ncbi:MAG TPA: 2OG-Fe(II) oxygenase [Rhizomicrobium sp.]|nr:2OG-Fe(II) oxygenase [Rhizomicrobium sp.]
MTQAPQELLDLDRLKATPVADVPFPFLIVPNFIRTAAKPRIAADFPEVTKAGSFPLPSLDYGPAFDALIDSLTSPEMTRIVEEKFGIDLAGRPTMATVRGRCEARDGHIHTDSKTKLITLLLYMNDHADADIGRLRILRSSTDLNDMAAEVPADEGTLLLFLNGPNAWHGFEPFSGPRRVIQVNWVTDESVVRREQARHRLSAFFKRLVSKSARHAAAY